MTDAAILYCTYCARPGDAGSDACPSCGRARELPPAERAGHVAFVLNQLRLPPMRDILAFGQQDRLERFYESELSSLVPRTLAPQSAPPATAAPVAQALPAPRRRGTVTFTRPVAAGAAPPGAPPPPPATPREPMDWTWLTEHQANLFLFAGAFLTVVAALIYVGYSGQAVSGGLKMSLLVAYTLAFLAGGAVCLRIPRVEMAGRVFFAVGAMLVPLNFVAARSIFADEDLSLEALWLAGSLVTAVFYTAVAWLGIGRMYAFGAGVAALSATLAACAVAEVPIEWVPLAIIAISLAMVLTDGPANETLRERAGIVWSLQGQVAATVAAAGALLLAPFVADSQLEVDWTTRWYLPATMLAFAAAAALPAVLTKRPHFAVAALAGAAAAWVSTAYALEQPAEGYTVAFASLAAATGLAMLALRDSRIAARLPAVDGSLLYATGVGATSIAAVIGFIALEAATGDDATRDLANRWFIPVSFALVAAFFAVDVASTAGRARGSEEFSAAATLAGFAGVAAGTAYLLDLPLEAYAYTLAALALAFGITMPIAAHARVAGRLPREFGLMLSVAGALSTLAAAAVALYTLEAAEDAFDPYGLRTRWFAAIAATLALAFYGVDALMSRRRAVWGAVASLAALCASVVYALDVSGEYYPFALIVPAIALAAGARWAPATGAAARFNAAWREDTIVLTRAGAAIGASIAGVAAIAGTDEDAAFALQSRYFLPVAFAAATVVFAIDASRRREAGATAAVLVAAGGVALSLPFLFEAGAAWYGLTLAAAGIAVAFAGRVWQPSWIDARARDGVALAAVVASTLPFEGAYAGLPRVGAAVHFAAALFFAVAAVRDRSARTLGDLIESPRMTVRLAMGWLYAAGAAATVGYVYVLYGVPAAEDAGGGSLALPIMFASVAFMLAGVALTRVRPEFRVHLYIMSLLLALGSLAVAPDAATMAALLTVYVAAWLALAAFEDAPALGVPGALFGFAAVAAWQQHLDADPAAIPALYAAIGASAYAAAVASRTIAPHWSRASRVAGAAYALIAPAAGFAILASQAGPDLHESTLYQWTVGAVALVGLLALVESMLAGRRWIIVPASTALLVAVLLQIVRAEPDNAQAYTVVIGAYLVGLAVLGLSRFKLIAGLEPAAFWVEALGAATIMLPSFLQSFDGGWRYEVILLAEAAAFFSAAVVLRRRGLLSASITFLVLVAGRTTVDVVNALPNWIVVMAAGMVLLGIGMAILAGRDRWELWQRTLRTWWDEAANGAAST